MKPNEYLKWAVFFIIVLAVGLAVVRSTFDNSASLSGHNSFQNETLLLDNGSSQTLLHPPQSLNVSAYNQTWLHFDGINDFIDIPPNSLFDFNRTSTNFTIAFWINGTSLGANDGIIGKWDSGGAPHWYVAYTGTGSNLTFFQWANSTTTQQHIINVNHSTRQGLWEFFVVTSNNTHVCWYRGSTFADCTATTIVGSNINTRQVNIGTIGSNSTTFALNASVDEVRMYNTTLNISEVASLFSLARTRNSAPLGTARDANLIFYQSFNENSGVKSYDSAALANNGTLAMAFYENDNVTNTLSSSTDYSATNTDVFTLINDAYSYTEMRVQYIYNSASTSMAYPIMQAIGLILVFILIILAARPLVFNKPKDEKQETS